MTVKTVMLPKICTVTMLLAGEAVENDKAYAAAPSVAENMSPVGSE